ALDRRADIRELHVIMTVPAISFGIAASRSESSRVLDSGHRIAEVEMKIAPFRARAEWSAILVAFAATSPVGVALGQTTPASPIVSDCRSPAGPSGYSSSAVRKPARSWAYCPVATASSR